MYVLNINPIFTKNNVYQEIIKKYTSRKKQIINALENELLKSKQQLLLLQERFLVVNKVIYRTNDKILKLKIQSKYEREKREIDTSNLISDEPIFSFKQIEPRLFNSMDTKIMNKYLKDNNLKFNLDFITKREINSLLLKNKSNKLNEIISFSVKIKPFKKEINIIKNDINNIKLKIVEKTSTIIKLRKEKIEYYKKLDLQIYNNINKNITDGNLSDRYLSNISISFFFDNVEIYSLIQDCNLLTKDLINKNIDLQIIKNKIKYYNSKKVQNLLSSISNIKKNNKSTSDFVNKHPNKSANISIYINNELKYRHFILKLNNIFLNHFEKSLKINKDNIEMFIEKIIYIENKINVIENLLDFKQVNTILINVCKNYQKQINTFELNEFKKMKHDY